MEVLLYVVLALQVLACGLIAWLFRRTRAITARLPEDPDRQVEKLRAEATSSLQASTEETTEALHDVLRTALQEATESMQEAQVEARRETVQSLEEQFEEASASAVEAVRSAYADGQQAVEETLQTELEAASKQTTQALREAMHSTSQEMTEALQAQQAEVQNSLQKAVRKIVAAQQSQREMLEETLTDRLETLLRDLLPTDDHERAVREWIDAASEEDDEAALRRLEAAFAQYPASRLLFEKLLAYYRPLLAADQDLDVRREAVLQLDEHARRFAEHCALQDFSFARQKQDEIDEWMHTIRDVQRAQRRAELAEQVGALEERVADLARDPTTTDEETVDELKRLDRAIDSEELRAYEDLQETYDRVSQKLVAHFRQADRRERAAVRRRYNREALDAIQEAWEVVSGEQGSWNPFSKEAVHVEDTDQLQALADRLGGWETQHLTPAVSKYLSAVYAEIFQQLDPDSQVALTQKMVEAPLKPWDAYQQERTDTKDAETS